MLKLGDKSTGENSITFRNVICAWAEQQGGVHEDWRVDEMLLKTQTSAFGEVGGKRVSIARINMTAIASKAIESANRLLDGIRRLERLRAK
jgi:hypothetical protein